MPLSILRIADAAALCSAVRTPQGDGNLLSGMAAANMGMAQREGLRDRRTGGRLDGGMENALTEQLSTECFRRLTCTRGSIQ